jgi:6-phosphogluconolactonase (cycloisomerase 2 family)
MSGVFRCAIVLVGVLASLATAALVGVSGALDPFRAQLDVARADAVAQAATGDAAAAKSVRTIDGIVRRLERRGTAASYAAEMSAAAKSAKVVEKALAADGDLLGPLASAAGTYRADVGAARDDLSDAIPTLAGRSQRAAQKRLAKADALLVRADAATAVSARIAALARAAKLLRATPGAAALRVDGTPYDLTVDSTGRYVYVAQLGDATFDSGTFHGDVRQMSIDASGALADLDPPSVPGVQDPTSIVAHPTKGLVYVGNYGGASVSQYAVGPGGRLVPLDPPTVPMPVSASVAALTTDAAGRFVFALGSTPGGSPMTAFRVEDDGTLTQTGFEYTFPQAAWLASAPDGSYVIAAHAFRSAYVYPTNQVFLVDGFGAVTQGPTLGSQTQYTGLTIPSAGGRLYALHEQFSNAPSTLVAFSLGADGAMTQIGDELDVGTRAFDLAIAPAGDRLYVANTFEGSVSQFTVHADGSVAALSPATVAATAPRAPFVTRDGRFLLTVKSHGRGVAANLVEVFAIGADGTLSAP